MTIDFTYFLLLLAALILLVAVLVFFSRVQQQPWKAKARQKLQQLKSTNSDPKFKVIELDKLLEYVLQNRFNQHDSLGSILKSKAGSIDKSRLNEIWQAHKVRNNLAHNVDFTISSSDIQEAIRILIKYIYEFTN